MELQIRNANYTLKPRNPIYRENVGTPPENISLSVKYLKGKVELNLIVFNHEIDMGCLKEYLQSLDIYESIDTIMFFSGIENLSEKVDFLKDFGSPLSLSLRLLTASICESMSQLNIVDMDAGHTPLETLKLFSPLTIGIVDRSEPLPENWYECVKSVRCKPDEDLSRFRSLEKVSVFHYMQLRLKFIDTLPPTVKSVSLSRGYDLSYVMPLYKKGVRTITFQDKHILYEDYPHDLTIYSGGQLVHGKQNTSLLSHISDPIVSSYDSHPYSCFFYSAKNM